MEGGVETVTDAEEPSCTDDFDDPCDLDGISPSASTLPGGRACNVVATVFCLILSAAVITYSLFLLFLKTPPSPLDDHGMLSVAVLLPETQEPQDSSEATPTRGSVADGKMRRYHPWMGCRGDNMSDEDEDGPRSFDTNMYAFEYLC